MILQALVGFYEQLAKEHPEKIARVGWCSRQVAFMLVLSSEGELVNVIPSDEKRGWTMMVPEQVKRTVGVAANLLCDNATYLLGIDAKGKPERARQCFEAARERHLAFLQGRSAVSSKRGTLKMRFPAWPLRMQGRLCSLEGISCSEWTARTRWTIPPSGRLGKRPAKSPRRARLL